MVRIYTKICPCLQPKHNAGEERASVGAHGARVRLQWRLRSHAAGCRLRPPQARASACALDKGCLTRELLELTQQAGLSALEFPLKVPNLLVTSNKLPKLPNSQVPSKMPACMALPACVVTA